MSNLIYTIPFYRITPYVCGVALSVLLYRVGKHVKIPKVYKKKKKKEKINIKINQYIFHQLVVNLGWSFSAIIITWMLYWPRDIMREDYVFDIVSLTNFVVINQILWTLAQCWIIFACYTNNGGGLLNFSYTISFESIEILIVSGVINKFLSHHWFVVFSKISYSFYLIQFIFFFYEIGTIRYPDIFYIFQLVRREIILSFYFGKNFLQIDLFINVSDQF